MVKLLKDGVENIVLNLYNSMCGGCRFSSLCHKEGLNYLRMSRCISTVKVMPDFTYEEF